jgi:hypothetical protein
MTEDRLPLAELMAKAGDGDFLRSVAEAVVQLLMETDVDGLIGAGRQERTGDRTTYPNGYRDRTLDTRLGGAAQGSACVAGGIAAEGACSSGFPSCARGATSCRSSAAVISAHQRSPLQFLGATPDLVAAEAISGTTLFSFTYADMARRSTEMLLAECWQTERRQDVHHRSGVSRQIKFIFVC